MTYSTLALSCGAAAILAYFGPDIAAFAVEILTGKQVRRNF